MRVSLFAALTLCASAVSVAAWSKEDHEIFRLNDEVQASEGQDVTFYDFVGISPSANQDEISKAYRKKSRLIHPDKVKQSYVANKATKAQSKDKKKKPGVHVTKSPSKSEISSAVKEASARFARLGLVTNILRGPGRDRYDHFLKNGFPRWRGTGYYYTRFRPGLWSVLVGLFVFGGGAIHYGAMYLSWKRQKEFVDRYVRHARRSAWGDELGIRGINLDGVGTTPSASSVDAGDAGLQSLNRRQRRMQEKGSKKSKGTIEKTSSPVDTPTAPLQRKRVTAENGKILIVDSVGNVYLEEQNDEGETEEYLLDPDELPRPTIQQTLLIRFPIWIYNQSTRRALALIGKGPTAPVATDESEGSENESDIAKSSGVSKRRAKRNGRGGRG